MHVLKGTNLALRFLLELAALGALGYWGYQTGTGSLSRIALAIGAPLLAAVIWGLFVAPKATFATHGALRLGLQLLVFGAAALALADAGQATLAIMFGAIAAANAALMAVWNQ
jgi:hypothetical protein